MKAATWPCLSSTKMVKRVYYRSQKKRRVRRRRFARRMPRISRTTPKRMLSNINKHPISYIREVPFNNIQIPIGGNKVFFAYYFALTNLPNYTEFTNLFDQYRIKCAIIKFRLINPPEATNTPASSQFYPDIYVTVDHDDATLPTAVDDILQYGKCKRGILRPNTWFKYKCYPTPAIQLYRSGTQTAYAPARNSMWLDLAYTDTPYYAIKGVVSNEAAGIVTSALTVEVHVTYIVHFKNSR